MGCPAITTQGFFQLCSYVILPGQSLGPNPKTTDHLVQEHAPRMSPSSFPAQGLPKLFF